MKGAKPLGDKLDDMSDRREVLGATEFRDGLEIACEKSLRAAARKRCAQEQLFEWSVIDGGEPNDLEDGGFGASVFDSRDALSGDAGAGRERSLGPSALAPIVAEALSESPKAFGEGLATTLLGR